MNKRTWVWRKRMRKKRGGNPDLTPAQRKRRNRISLVVAMGCVVFLVIVLAYSLALTNVNIERSKSTPTATITPTQKYFLLVFHARAKYKDSLGNYEDWEEVSPNATSCPKILNIGIMVDGSCKIVHLRGIPYRTRFISAISKKPYYKYGVLKNESDNCDETPRESEDEYLGCEVDPSSPE